MNQINDRSVKNTQIFPLILDLFLGMDLEFVTEKVYQYSITFLDMSKRSPCGGVLVITKWDTLLEPQVH